MGTFYGCTVLRAVKQQQSRQQQHQHHHRSRSTKPVHTQPNFTLPVTSSLVSERRQEARVPEEAGKNLLRETSRQRLRFLYNSRASTLCSPASCASCSDFTTTTTQ